MPTRAKTVFQRRPQRPRPPDHRVSARKRGYDRAWEKVRAAHLAYNPLCVFCGDVAGIVDHRTPLSQGGARLEEHNLRSVCRRCHDRLTANLRRTGRNEMPAQTLEE